MSTPTLDPDPALIQAACALLRQFTCTEPASETTDSALVRQAMRVVADHSDYQILGICAETLAEGEAALRSYGQALGYEVPVAIAPTITGPTYIKFNPKTGRCHADGYIGVHRGVLVSCQSAYDGDVNETFGHLPMDLFAA
jgi:Domain of unknown function (DUF1824)